MTRPPDPVAATARAVAAAVAAHPGVARLDGGPWGTVTSHLPGRARVDGVRLGVGAESVEIAVVARLGVPLPQLADELAAAVRGVLGPVPVDVTFSDVVPALAAAPAL
ncbi:hypothetical protein [Pseudonocardia abyssalis]|uniref:hypothetical protein n=2 Tax=Pseudonocardia abyssalis TaxID=2792008 RepID=UPI001C4A5E8C|nr:hypothetical protein [Pseudonocardia abyssalis]